MDEMKQYKIVYMNGITKGEEIVSGIDEQDAIDKFLNAHPDYSVIYSSQYSDQEKEETNNSVDDNDSIDEKKETKIVGANLKEIKKQQEKEKAILNKKMRSNEERSYKFNINAASFGFKIFFSIIGMSLLIYPIMGLIKLMDNDLYKALIEKTDYDVLTILYLLVVVGMVFVYIVNGIIILIRLVKLFI